MIDPTVPGTRYAAAGRYPTAPPTGTGRGQPPRSPGSDPPATSASAAALRESLRSEDPSFLSFSSVLSLSDSAECDHGAPFKGLVRLQGVNSALGNLAMSERPAFDSNGDHKVTVDELVTAVNAALNGCGG